MPTFQGFDLNDGSTYVTTEIEYRSYSAIETYTSKIPRRAGAKLLGREFDAKQIKLGGYVTAASAGALQTAVDSLHSNLNTRQTNELKALVIDSGRTYQAFVSTLAIPTQFFNQTYVPWEATFVAPDPFAYGPMNTLTGTVASGTRSASIIMTVSGTVWAEPTLTMTFNAAAAGTTTVSGIVLEHINRGTSITVSGTAINYNVPFVTTWSGVQVTVSGTGRNFAGNLSRWEPGPNQLQITTTSGTNPGYTWSLKWQERYI